jgi:hypothetical protein
MPPATSRPAAFANAAARDRGAGNCVGSSVAAIVVAEEVTARTAGRLGDETRFCARERVALKATTATITTMIETAIVRWRRTRADAPRRGLEGEPTIAFNGKANLS